MEFYAAYEHDFLSRLHKAINVAHSEKRQGFSHDK